MKQPRGQSKPTPKSERKKRLRRRSLTGRRLRRKKLMHRKHKPMEPLAQDFAEAMTLPIYWKA